MQRKDYGIQNQSKMHTACILIYSEQLTEINIKHITISILSEILPGLKA